MTTRRRSATAILVLSSFGLCAIARADEESNGWLYPKRGMISAIAGRFYPRPPVSSSELRASSEFLPADGVIEMSGGVFRTTAAMQPDSQPLAEPDVQPPTEPSVAAPPEGGPAGFPDLSLVAQYVSEAGNAPATEVAIQPVQTPQSAADILAKSDTSQSVSVQRRSPISFEPHVRGYHDNQIFTEGLGAYWLPARLDLDSVLSKLDPALIDRIVVIPGPYGLRYGPGFSYIDVQYAPTPRYDCGPETHVRTGVNYLANGEQWFGRTGVSAGGATYGYRFSYGHRLGSDYDSGDGTDIASSYQAQNFLGDFEFDLTPSRTAWFHYVRLDQTDTELPLQLYDIRFLGTDGFSAGLVEDDPVGPWDRFAVSGWYNRNRYTGDTANSAKQATVTSRIERNLDSVLGFGTDFQSLTDGALTSTGGRASVTFGDLDAARLSFGGDYRFLSQGISERSTITALDSTNQGVLDNLGLSSINLRLPASRMSDAGVFSEVAFPVTCCWTLGLGGRVDFVHMNADPNQIRTVNFQNIQITNVPRDQLSQNDILYAFYGTSDLQVTDVWTLRTGFGQAQRVPSFVERYSDGVTLGIIQSGLSRVIGVPTLKKERNWQVDAGVYGDNGVMRGGVNCYFAWVSDFITFEDQVNQIDPSIRVIRHINTDLATLTGFTAHGEVDLAPRLTPFATVAYVEGRDQQINQPLWQIAPLGSRMGIRLHDPEGGRSWGIELAARVVDNQDRLAAVRDGTGGVIGLELPTAGFTVWNLSSYVNCTDNLRFTAGILNLFDKNYLEHLDLRFVAVGQLGLGPLSHFSPGFTPYGGVEWTY